MKKRMIKLMTIFCMAGILTVNPVIIGLAEGMDAVGADVPEDMEASEEEPETADEEAVEEEPVAENVEESEEADTETGEEEPAVETEETLEETQAEEVSETATMSANEAAVPVVMAAEDEIATQAEEQYIFKYVYNDGTNASSSDEDNTLFAKEYLLKTKPESNKGTHYRNGYDFIGWEKDGTIYQPGATYTVTSDDIEKKNITFTAVWRQQVAITIDGEAVSLEVEEGATKKSVSYDLSTAKDKLNSPGNAYVFANKWVINSNGTPYNATDTMTVNFEQTDGNLVFDAKSVRVDGMTDVSITDKDIKLASCWNSVEGHYNLLIKNGTAGTLTADGKVAGDDGTIDLEDVQADSKITFNVKGWTLEKLVSDLVNAEPEYIKKNEKYYQYRESTITDADFEKTIHITYQDENADTRFFHDGKDAGNSVLISNTIHAGLDEKWAGYLGTGITAQRGDYLFAGWRYFLNEKEVITDPEATVIDFYNDDAHSLTVQPIWKGSYTCIPNYPTNQGGGTEPETKTAEVGTNITLLKLKNIDGKYTFEGWLGSDGNTYQGGDSYTIEKANMTFTAQWKAVSYNLKFVDEDGTIYSEGKADFNTQITWPSEPTKEGYTFQNWIVEIDKEEMPVKHGTNFYMYDQDMTFTAQWSINSYKISYDGNGAAMGVPAESVEQNYQTDYTIDTVIPTKTGYTFQGWSDGTTTYQPGATFKVPAKDVVLTAQWKINSHQVKYDGNGGKTGEPESKNADYNSNVSVAAGPEKDGYLFEGWEQISTGRVLAPGASFVMPDMDETLKAKWKIAYSSINGKGTYYLVSGQSYTLASGLKVQGDNSSYSGNMTFYVPQSGYYTFE